MAKEEKKKEEEKPEAKEEEKAPKEGEEKPAGEGGEAAEGAEGEKKEKKGLTKKKKIILIVTAVVVVIGIAVPAVLFITGKIGKKAAVEGEVAAEGEGGKGAHQAVFYDMEEFLVNLNVGSKRPSFLKMTVSLEVASELQIPTIEKNMPRIRDNFQVYLRELRQDDLQGSAGLYRLREELLLRVNKVVYPAKVNDILFKEILVQ